MSPWLRRAAHFQECLESILGRWVEEGIGFIGVGAPLVSSREKMVPIRNLLEIIGNPQSSSGDIKKVKSAEKFIFLFIGLQNSHLRVL